MSIKEVMIHLSGEGYGDRRSMQCITFANIFVTVEGLPRSVEDFAKKEECRSGNWCGAFDVHTDLILRGADILGNFVIDFFGNILVL